MYTAVLSKERHKFAAAHFTLFPATHARPATVERLHGHNYQVTVSIAGDRLADGMLVPFEDAKRAIADACALWDERVLLPTESPHVVLGMTDGEQQVEARVALGDIRKLYSLPREDVALVACDNITCEHLARVFCDNLLQRLDLAQLGLERVAVSINEGGGQAVSYARALRS